MPQVNSIEFRRVFNPIIKEWSTEVTFDNNEEIYVLFHHDESPILWINDESESIGLSRSFLEMALPILKKFVETGDINQ